MSVSASKTVHMIVSRKRRISTDITIRIKDQVIPRAKEHRFLGIIIDDRLSWRPEIKRLTAICKSSTNILKILAGKNSGAATSCLLRVQSAVTMSKLLYSGRYLLSAKETIVERVNIIQRQSVRVALGLLRSTPRDQVLAEAGQYPVLMIAKEQAVKHLLRSAKCTNDSRLAARVFNRKFSAIGGHFRKLGISENLLANPTKNPNFPQKPLWLVPTVSVCNYIDGLQDNKTSVFPSAIQSLFKSHLNEHYSGYSYMYTDGSCTSTSSAAAFYFEDNMTAGSCRLPFKTSSTNAELCAIREALIYIDSLVDKPSKVVVITDSNASLQCIKNVSGKNVNKLLLNEIFESVDSLFVSGTIVVFQWVPSHVGILGNERADLVANEGHQQTLTVPMEHTAHDILSQVSFQQDKLDWWNGLKGSYRYKVNSKFPKVLNFKLRRRVMVTLHRCRTGHARTCRILYKIGKGRTELCTTCNEVDTVEHIIMRCKRYCQERKILSDGLLPAYSNCSIYDILNFEDNPEILKYLLTFLEKSGLMERL